MFVFFSLSLMVTSVVLVCLLQAKRVTHVVVGLLLMVGCGSLSATLGAEVLYSITPVEVEVLGELDEAYKHLSEQDRLYVSGLMGEVKSDGMVSVSEYEAISDIMRGLKVCRKLM